MHIKSEELTSLVYKELLQANMERMNRKMGIGYAQEEERQMFQSHYN